MKDTNGPSSPVASQAQAVAPGMADLKPTLSERYARWWLDDYPPLDGRLRFLWYCGVLYLLQNYRRDMSLFGGIGAYEATDPEVYTARGLLSFVGYVDPAVLRIVIAITKAAMFASAIGLFHRFSAAAAAMGAVFLHGMFFDITGGNRYWYLTVYAMCCLAFASAPQDGWSVDYYLLKHRLKNGSENAGHVPPRHRSVAETGFSRKCFLVMVVGFYVASGLSKIYTAGLRWANGQTLRHHLEGHDNFLAHLLSDHLVLGVVGSAGALFLEAGAFLMLLGGIVRPVFLVSLSLMHLAIYISMNRWYFPNVWSFILLVDWGTAAHWVRASYLGCRLAYRQSRRRPANDLLEEAALLNSEAAPPPLEIGTTAPGGVSKTSARVATTCGSCLLTLFAAVAVFQIEYWPLTNVDLYSTYYDKDLKAMYPKSYFYDAEGAQRIARETKASGKNRKAQCDLAGMVELQLISSKRGKKERKPLKLRKGVGVNMAKQWKKSVLRHVIVADLLSKPKGKLDFDPDHPDNPASLFLWRIRPVIKRHVRKWDHYDYAVLMYPLKDGDVMIAKAPLIAPEKGEETNGRPRKIEKNGEWMRPTGVHVSFFALGMCLYFWRVRIRAYAKKILASKDGLPIHETVALSATS